MILPAILTAIHAVDAVLTWLFGRNTEYGILFKNLTDSAWKFWPARIGFYVVIMIGCELYRANYGTQLYWWAIGFQLGILWSIYSKWKQKK